MTRNPTEIAVVAAALRDASGRWLMQKRPAHKHHGGLWEFPGGKVEPGESPRAALVRELNEELTITASEDAMVLLATAADPLANGAVGIVISLYRVAVWRGCPAATEPGAELGWYTRNAIARLAVPPLDAVLARSLPGPV